MESKDNNLPPLPPTADCPQCQQKLAERVVDYIVAIEHFPRVNQPICAQLDAWVCDPCGLVFYEPVEAMERVRQKISEICGERQN